MKRVLLILAVTALVVGTLAAPVTAGGKKLDHWRPVYLAMGDSVAAGQEAADWTEDGYVPLFRDHLRRELDCWPHAKRLNSCRPLLLKNLSRPAIPELELPGVTSALVIEEQLPKALRIIHRRNGDRWRFNDVRMITLTVGGNDISGPITAACITADPLDLEVCSETIADTFVEFQGNLTKILMDLRTAAPDTPIIVSTQYNPIVGCPLADAYPIAPQFAGLVLEGGTIPPGAIGNPVEITISPGFNEIIEAVTAAFGATVADLYPAMDVDDYVGDCLHPNTEGHRTIADVFIDAFDG